MLLDSFKCEQYSWPSYLYSIECSAFPCDLFSCTHSMLYIEKNRSCTWDLGSFWIMPLYGADHRRPIQEVVRPFASLFNGTSSKKMSYMSSCCIYIFYQQICFEYRRLLAASFCKSWQTAWLLCGVVSYFLAPVPNVGTKKGAWTSHIGPSFRRRRRILLLFFRRFFNKRLNRFVSEVGMSLGFFS